MGGHPAVGRDLQHVPEPVLAHRAAQGRVGAVDLVAGHPPGRDTGLHRAGDHRCSQRGFGRELDAVRNAGSRAPAWVGGPGLRQVQRPVDQRVPPRCSVGEEDGDLGVLDASRGAGVLTLHPDRLVAFLHVAGLIDNQHRAGIGEGVDDIATQLVADRVGVPLRAGQQVLQPVRAQLAIDHRAERRPPPVRTYPMSRGHRGG